MPDGSAWLDRMQPRISLYARTSIRTLQVANDDWSQQPPVHSDCRLVRAQQLSFAHCLPEDRHCSVIMNARHGKETEALLLHFTGNYPSTVSPFEQVRRFRHFYGLKAK
jgi:hypothetical protein